MPRGVSRRQNPGGKKTKAGAGVRQPKASQEALAALLEQALASVLTATPEDEALDRAQEMVFDAWESNSAKIRVAKARKALAISPRCADAYLLLAEETVPNSDEQFDLYRRAVAAGEEALGKHAFAEDVGHFWGLIETRPYMRARFEFAQALWRRNRRDEAIAHLTDMLRLNPNDNQGVRYSLAAYLLESDRDADLAALLTRYRNDGSAWWAYSRVLHAFRTEGPSAAARYLVKAVAANSHVPAYLLGRKRMPARLPEFYSPGAANEAVCYVKDCGRGWQRSDGALDWLSRQGSDG